MSTQSQELMTPELAAQIKEYERQLRHWHSTKSAQRRGALYAFAFAVPFWIISYVLSAQTGVANQDAWFTAATVFSFIGALGTTIVALVLGGIAFSEGEPVKEFTTEKMVNGG